MSVIKMTSRNGHFSTSTILRSWDFLLTKKWPKIVGTSRFTIQKIVSTLLLLSSGSREQKRKNKKLCLNCSPTLLLKLVRILFNFVKAGNVLRMEKFLATQLRMTNRKMLSSVLLKECTCKWAKSNVFKKAAAQSTVANSLMSPST